MKKKQQLLKKLTGWQKSILLGILTSAAIHIYLWIMYEKYYTYNQFSAINYIHLLPLMITPGISVNIGEFSIATIFFVTVWYSVLCLAAYLIAKKFSKNKLNLYLTSVIALILLVVVIIVNYSIMRILFGGVGT